MPKPGEGVRKLDRSDLLAVDPEVKTRSGRSAIAGAREQMVPWEFLGHRVDTVTLRRVSFPAPFSVVEALPSTGLI